MNRVFTYKELLLLESLRHKSIPTLKAMASDKNTSAAILRFLSRHRDVFIRCSVANNVSVSKEILNDLLYDEAFLVRSHVRRKVDFSLRMFLNDIKCFFSSERNVTYNTSLPAVIRGKLSSDK